MVGFEQSARFGRINQAAMLLAIYPAWLAMMACHEAGHVLHAWFSGGEVRRVSVPLWGFSLTELGTNPHPTLVAWGGAIWGSLIPIAALALMKLFDSPIAVRRCARWFAAFCLVANGAYLFAALIEPVGDAADLLRGGVPKWVVVAVGTVLLYGGIFLWHRSTAGRIPRAQDNNC